MADFQSGRYWMVQWSGGGGFGHYAWLLSDAIARGGRDVVLLTRQTHELGSLPHCHRAAGVWPDAPNRPPGVVRRVHVLVGGLRGWLRLLALVRREARTGDIVHVQPGDRLGEVPFLVALRLMGLTLVVTAHNVFPHDSGYLGRAKVRLLYRLPHGIVTHTEENAELIRALAGRSPRVLVTRHPSYLAIVDHFATDVAPTETRPLRVSHLGTVRPYKGFGRVVDAVRLARTQHSDLEFWVVGRPDHSCDVPTLIGDLQAGGVNLDLGHVPIARLVAAAHATDVVVLGHTSTSESGIAHLALGAGAAVVGPKVFAIERLLSGEPSWMYDPTDVDDAGRALISVLDDVVRDSAAVRRRARAVAESVPTWNEVAADTTRFVDKLAGAEPVRRWWRAGSREDPS